MYHLAYFINPKSNQEKIESEILKLIKQSGGEVVEHESAKLKSLAYPIQHFREGFFGFINFKIKKLQITEINKKLSLNQELLRYSIFKQEFAKKPLSLEKSPKDKKSVVLHKKQPKLKIDELDKELDQMLDQSLE